jgi:hypothetical protein
MSKEQASAWKLWQQNPCWQDFLNIVQGIKDKSVKQEDSVATPDLNIAIVAEARGVRKGLNSLLREIEEITSER